MDKSNNKGRRFRILPDSAGLSIAFLFGLLAEALFLLLVLALDVLPFQYIIAIVAVLFAINIVMIILMNNKRRASIQRILGLIVLVLVLNVLLLGDFYVYSTYDTLQKISKYRATWEIYNVVTKKDGSYNTIDDIKGETVSVVDMDSKQLTEAKERLVTGENVSYNEMTNMIDVGKQIMDDDGEIHDNIILVTRDHYSLIDDQIKGFKKNTQVIYRIKVKKRANDSAKRIDVTEESFNVLISGKDVWGKLKSSKSGLSDVNMVMTVNPKTKEVLLTSIPRDSYVTLHSYGAKDKLTHTGIYGEEETKATIEDFLGIDINYGITVNFSMLVDIIDAIDGIDVYSDYDFTSAIADYSYEKGWNHLKGRPALYFARERKSFADGDMQRNKNQQKVLKATIEKVTSSKVILTRYSSLLNAVEDEMYTDLTDRDLKKLAKLTLKNMKQTWTVNTVNVSGGTGGAPCYSMGNMELSCVFPTEESVQKAKKAIHDTMYPVDNTIRKNHKKKEEGTKENADDGTKEKSERNEE
ncbi:MAG: LCP family protein [Bacillota bacterium]|nr:LCP family protein [Bacillota bacterium]